MTLGVVNTQPLKHFLSRGDFKLLNERVHPDKRHIRK